MRSKDFRLAQRPIFARQDFAARHQPLRLFVMCWTEFKKFRNFRKCAEISPHGDNSRPCSPSELYGTEFQVNQAVISGPPAAADSCGILQQWCPKTAHLVHDLHPHSSRLFSPAAAVRQQVIRRRRVALFAGRAVGCRCRFPARQTMKNQVLVGLNGLPCSACMLRITS